MLYELWPLSLQGNSHTEELHLELQSPGTQIIEFSQCRGEGSQVVYRLARRNADPLLPYDTSDPTSVVDVHEKLIGGANLSVGPDRMCKWVEA